MGVLKQMSGVMESPWAYALWQAPFLNKKFAPIRKHNDITRVKRVLDVGCGPGTNSRFFKHTDYVGIDINSAYLERARRKYHRTYIEADVCEYTPPADQLYDFVLLNSLLHHIDDASVDRILRAIGRVLVNDGCVHIIDLILPDKPSIARHLTVNDRGDYPRPWEKWKEMFGRSFDTVVMEAFPVGMAGLELWQMLYFKGRPKPQVNGLQAAATCAQSPAEPVFSAPTS
jgi:SAM-dependent methyltransferase